MSNESALKRWKSPSCDAVLRKKNGRERLLAVEETDPERDEAHPGGDKYRSICRSTSGLKGVIEELPEDVERWRLRESFVPLESIKLI